MLEMDGFKKLFAYPNDFKVNLIVYDYSVGPCFLGFAHKFKYPPIVSVTAFNNPSFTPEIIGGHQYYSYAPHIYLTHRTKTLTLLERIDNMIIHTIEIL